MSVRVTDYISTTASSDTYPTHKSVLGNGGHQEVATINDRNAITPERRATGMKVYVAADNTTYELDSGGNWVVFGGNKSYDHNQVTPATVWVIDHNLGMYPNILIIDSVGEQVMGNTTFDSINKVTLTFSAPIYGHAYLS
jgi:hypothetical protein